MRKALATVFVGCSAMVCSMAAALVFSPTLPRDEVWTILLVTQWCSLLVAVVCILQAEDAE